MGEARHTATPASWLIVPEVIRLAVAILMAPGDGEPQPEMVTGRCQHGHR